MKNFKTYFRLIQTVFHTSKPISTFNIFITIEGSFFLLNCYPVKPDRLISCAFFPSSCLLVILLTLKRFYHLIELKVNCAPDESLSLFSCSCSICADDGTRKWMPSFPICTLFSCFTIEFLYS